MISSYDLIVFYLGLELQSISLYILASFKKRNEKSTEAGLKYFVLSALATGLLFMALLLFTVLQDQQILKLFQKI